MALCASPSCGLFDDSTPNVVIVLSDTLRRDHLSVYGYDRPTSPNIDAFAASATRYTNAFAQSPSTKPSVTSLFTSLYPTQHQVIRNKQALPDTQVTLAEILKTNGFTTAAFVENSVIGAQFGFDQGFDDWTFDNTRHFESEDTMEAFDDAILAWLSSRDTTPFFLYVHYIDPHTPYMPPKQWKRRFHRGTYTDSTTFGVGDHTSPRVERNIARYDEEIAYVDDRIGRVLAHLDALEFRENTLVVFLSDHGEAFMEHGKVHHSHSVYGELINIPLIIRYPGVEAPARVGDFAAHVDILPTILDVVGLDRMGMPLAGRSLVREGSREPLAGLDTQVVSEHLRGSGQRALMAGDRKLIHNIDTDRLRLYDLEADPLDAHPLKSRDDQKRSQNLQRELQRRVEEMGRPMDPNEIELDEETLDALKTLGYIR